VSDFAGVIVARNGFVGGSKPGANDEMDADVYKYDSGERNSHEYKKGNSSKPNIIIWSCFIQMCSLNGSE